MTTIDRQNDIPEDFQQGGPEQDDAEVLESAASTGMFMKRTLDGTLVDYGFDDAFDVATSAVATPEALCEMATDVPDETAYAVDPVLVRDRMMLEYLDQEFAGMMARADEDARTIREDLIDARRSSMFSVSNVPPPQVARIQADASAGDLSPMMSLKEKFLFA